MKCQLHKVDTVDRNIIMNWEDCAPLHCLYLHRTTQKLADTVSWVSSPNAP